MNFYGDFLGILFMFIEEGMQCSQSVHADLSSWEILHRLF